LLEQLVVKVFETAEFRSRHDLNHLDHGFHNLLERHQPFHEQFLEVVEELRGKPAQNLQVLFRELERSRFEVEVPGRLVENKPKINVDNMTQLIDQDIAVVSVFDLQEILHDAVAG
jgi:hypothetical protein